MFDIAAPGVIIGWLLWRYPELLDSVIPWLAFGVLWHLTLEICEAGYVKDKGKSAYAKWGKRPMTWFVVFLVGGVISLGYWYSIDRGLAKLAALKPVNSTASVTSEKKENKDEGRSTDSASSAVEAHGTSPINPSPILKPKHEKPPAQSNMSVLSQSEKPGRVEVLPPTTPPAQVDEHVPEQQPQVKKGFHENATAYHFIFGENGLSVSTTLERLKLGAQPFVGLPITVFANDKDDKVHYRIELWNGVIVTDDEFTLKEPFWDRNYDETALEVVDEKQLPVLQVFWKTPTTLVVNGIFQFQSGQIVIADDKGSRPFKQGDRLKPLFKYPSRRFPGKYAD
jgi:hypothetical protein